MTASRDIAAYETSDPLVLGIVPLVSVVVLAFNHEAYIADALESILSQQRDFPIEVLVGEDHSSDRTLEIVLDYQQRFPSVVRVLTAECNVGMNRNHFRLLRAARGRYIAYCEGDDFWNTTEKLSRQVRFLEERPAHGLVHSDYTHMMWLRGAWRVRRQVNRSSGRPPEGRVFDDLFGANFVSTGTVLARADAVRGYLDSWETRALTFPVGDWPLWLYVSTAWQIGYLDDDLATYRLTPGSVTNSGAASDIRRNRALVEMLAQLAEAFDVPDPNTALAQAALVRHVLHTAWRSGDQLNARWAMTWLEEYQPHLLTPSVRSKFRAFDAVPTLMKAYGFVSALRTRSKTRRIYREPAVLPSSVVQASHGNNAQYS